MEQSTRFALLSNAERYSYYLECGINAVDAIRVAMEEGSCAAEDFVDALFFVQLHLSDCQKGLQDAIEKLYKEDN